MGLGLEVGDGEEDGFFLLGVIKGIQFSLEFLDRVLMVLFVISFGGVQGGRGSAVDTFLQLLLLFLISDNWELLSFPPVVELPALDKPCCLT